MAGIRPPSTRHWRPPAGFAQSYARYVAAGWPALAADSRYGGQDAPELLHSAVSEILNARNPGWTMFPGTAHGAYQCLLAHGSQAQRDAYLPRIVTGEWTATMCLPEPHCGSDLGLLRTRAEPASDGSWRISGAKIFISGGEHDLAPNIVHLVLARLPGARAGVGGISLFVVPRFLPAADGGLATVPNGMVATAVEHKMGLRGSATCAMNFDGSTGWLVGQPHQGLRNMFVMINASRLGVGAQSVGMGQAAYGQSVAHARATDPVEREAAADRLSLLTPAAARPDPPLRRGGARGGRHGHLVCAWLFAQVAQRRLAQGADDPFYAAKLATAQFYVARLRPEADFRCRIARTEMHSLSRLPQERLFV